MEATIKQIVENELLYDRFLSQGNGSLERWLEKNHDFCYKYGVRHPCQFYELCFGERDTTEVPEGYVRRTPHHTGEEDVS